MEPSQAGKLVEEYLKLIYAFVLKRCSSEQDAEDLTQEISLKVYRALLRGDIPSVSGYVWTAARHTLANYYRGKQRNGIGLPIDEMAERLPSDEDVAARVIEEETVSRLHREIAYLSSLRRKIVVAYYYDGKPQEQIALELSIPLGTVKWHLFEARKDLKKGMETMRTDSELQFAPISFDICGTNGSMGAKGENGNFFHSALAQNIAYAVRQEGKTANEIAGLLGVSPVYVESEAEYLAEYGFLLKQGKRYLINILLDVPTPELVHLHDELYVRAAALFAGELYEELTRGSLLDELIQTGGIACCRDDRNFLLWSLIPYIAAVGGEERRDHAISFEEAATLRPDGGQNICYASVPNPGVEPPLYFASMQAWSGPMWNTDGAHTLWQVNSEWSARRCDDSYQYEVQRILGLLSRLFRDETLSPGEYAFLGEKGILKRDEEGNPALQIVHITSEEARQKLVAAGDRIKSTHAAELSALKEPLIKAVLAATPHHLRKMQGFGLQYLLYSDGWFLLHCLKALVNDGRLLPPPEDQQLSLTTLLLPGC